MTKLKEILQSAKTWFVATAGIVIAYVTGLLDMVIAFL
jgi:hypothetical protein